MTVPVVYVSMYLTVLFVLLLYTLTATSALNLDLILCNSTNNKLCPSIDPDMFRNASELIRSKGYICEEHNVKTDDGFILTVQRIPSKFNSTVINKKGVFFLQHGLLASSTNWIVNQPSQSLGFILADAGYDVWLGNVRGNTYSRSHIKYKPTDKQFWEWSFDEMAALDLPAMINFALKTSNEKQLYYVGHSQGTLIAFSNLSRNQTLKEKIKAVFALGPVATVGNIKGALRPLTYISTEIGSALNLLGVYDFLPSDDLIKLLASTVCETPVRQICSNIIFMIAGYDVHNFNMTRMPVYLTHNPAGTSVQNVLHFAQMVKSGKFQMYDYGSSARNIQHYDQKFPPLYSPSEISTPIALFFGGNDWLADPKDVTWLKSKLMNVFYDEEYSDYNHLDFIWGIDAAKRVYNQILTLAQSF